MQCGSSEQIIAQYRSVFDAKEKQAAEIKRECSRRFFSGLWEGKPSTSVDRKLFSLKTELVDLMEEDVALWKQLLKLQTTLSDIHGDELYTSDWPRESESISGNMSERNLEEDGWSSADQGRDETFMQDFSENETSMSERRRYKAFIPEFPGNGTSICEQERNEAFIQVIPGNGTSICEQERNEAFIPEFPGNGTSICEQERNETFIQVIPGNGTSSLEMHQDDTLIQDSRGNEMPITELFGLIYFKENFKRNGSASPHLVEDYVSINDLRRSSQPRPNLHGGDTVIQDTSRLRIPLPDQMGTEDNTVIPVAYSSVNAPSFSPWPVTEVPLTHVQHDRTPNVYRLENTSSNSKDDGVYLSGRQTFGLSSQMDVQDNRNFFSDNHGGSEDYELEKGNPQLLLKSLFPKLLVMDSQPHTRQLPHEQRFSMSLNSRNLTLLSRPKPPQKQRCDATDSHHNAKKRRHKKNRRQRLPKVKHCVISSYDNTDEGQVGNKSLEKTSSEAAEWCRGNGDGGSRCFEGFVAEEEPLYDSGSYLKQVMYEGCLIVCFNPDLETGVKARRQDVGCGMLGEEKVGLIHEGNETEDEDAGVGTKWHYSEEQYKSYKDCGRTKSSCMDDGEVFEWNGESASDESNAPMTTQNEAVSDAKVPYAVKHDNFCLFENTVTLIGLSASLDLTETAQASRNTSKPWLNDCSLQLGQIYSSVEGKKPQAARAGSIDSGYGED